MGTAHEKRGPFAHDGALLRRLAWLGAAYGPVWWLRYSPPAFGLAAAALVPSARRAVMANLVRIRGPVSRAREALEVAETFGTYASCFAEGLAAGSPGAAKPETSIVGLPHMEGAIALGKGVVLVTAHTAGWELTGPGLARDQGLDVTMVMEAEHSQGAQKLHDGVRRANGLQVAHVGDDPLASLGLVHQLRRGGAVAVQIDRMPAGMRSRPVRLFGADGAVPEGPIRLAEVTGAPIVPVFSARLGFRSYRVEVSEPIVLPRRPGEAARQLAAQRMADAMAAFLRAHPTQWFHFGE